MPSVFAFFFCVHFSCCAVICFLWLYIPFLVRTTGIDGEAIGGPREAPADDAGVRDGGGGGAEGMGISGTDAVHGQRGVDGILDETWDTAESPNFSAALQASFFIAMLAPWTEYSKWGVGGRIEVV